MANYEVWVSLAFRMLYGHLVFSLCTHKTGSSPKIFLMLSPQLNVNYCYYILPKLTEKTSSEVLGENRLGPKLPSVMINVFFINYGIILNV